MIEILFQMLLVLFPAQAQTADVWVCFDEAGEWSCSQIAEAVAEDRVLTYVGPRDGIQEAYADTETAPTSLSAQAAPKPVVAAAEPVNCYTVPLPSQGPGACAGFEQYVLPGHGFECVIDGDALVMCADGLTGYVWDLRPDEAIESLNN